MAKHYILKRPEPKFDGHVTLIRDKGTDRILDAIPDLSRGRYVSPWGAYELSLQSLTRGADILAVLQLRRKLQAAMDEEDAQFDAQYVIVTDAEKALLVEAVKTLDWTFSKQRGVMGSSFYVTWVELFETILDPERSGFSDYDVTRPSADYVADTTRRDARAVEVAARLEEAKKRYLESRDNSKAPASDAPVAETSAE